MQMPVKTSMMMRSRTTSWGQKGWPSTGRSFLVARRSLSIWAASRLYSPRSFDIDASSLPPDFKERLLALRDQRITKDGVVIIKAQEFRSQEMNRGEALRRLKELVQSIAVLPTVRRATKPTRSSQRKRMDSKAIRGSVKALRGKVVE